MRVLAFLILLLLNAPRVFACTCAFYGPDFFFAKDNLIARLVVPPGKDDLDLTVTMKPPRR